MRGKPEGPGGSSGGGGLALVRLALLLGGPLLALLLSSFSFDGPVLGLLFVGLFAASVDGIRQRKRLLPFPVFLLLVIAAQVGVYVLTAEQAKPAIASTKVVKDLGSEWQADVPKRMGGERNTIDTVSIVIAAYNEHKYMKRTIESIIQETPAKNLLEIIIVDDASDPPLLEAVSEFPQVKVLRNTERLGLIKSKIKGGNEAAGDSIMFLDGHVKPAKNWLQPLLKHMNINYKRVVVPLIPVLDGETWEANMNAVGSKMMFDWGLQFNWFEDGNDLVPCMSGGLFAITRRWWHESGEYDYGMNVWGGENIEQSIRLWTCGGEIYVARDSFVSHVFRQKFPYSVNSTQVYINKVRLVEVWFDQFKDSYYDADPVAKRFVPVMGDISERQKLKQNLHCKPFSWYMKKFRKVFEMKHMLPEATFSLFNMQTQLCVASGTDETGVSALIEVPCEDHHEEQRWLWMPGKVGMMNRQTRQCLDGAYSMLSAAENGQMQARTRSCDKKSTSQGWVLKSGHLKWKEYCIKAPTEQLQPATMAKCTNFLQASGPFKLIKVVESPLLEDDWDDGAGAS